MRRRGRSSRRRAWTVVVGLVVVDLLVAGGLLVNNVVSSDGGGHARPTDAGAHGRPAPSVGPKVTRTREIRALLARRAHAVLAHDAAGYLATVDPRASRFRRREAASFSNLRAVPFRSWHYTMDLDQVTPTRGLRLHRYHAPTWAPRVVLHYALRGFDRHPTSLDQYYTFVRRAGHWYVASDKDFTSRGLRTARDLWDFGPVVVVRHGRALVLGHPDEALSLDQLAAETDAAIPRVTAVWGPRWDRSVVVLAPGSERELSRLLCDAGDLSRIAAVASVEVSCTRNVLGPVNNRVMVNPVNYTSLSELGRRIVLTHEVTHVATRDATGPREPTWLIEGIADYVGFLGTELPVTTAARELATDVANGKPVGPLPRDHAYDGTNPNISQAYERSWLACRYIAGRYGQHALVRLYRQVGAAHTGRPSAVTNRAMHAVLGVSLVRFTRDWRRYVESVLR